MTRAGFTTLALLLGGCFAAGAAADTGPAADALAAEARTLSAATATASTEGRLNDIVHELSARHGDPAARALLEQLALREPQVFIRHTEGHAMVPLVDVGAAARAMLRSWDRQSAYRRAMLASRATQADFVAQYFGADDNARRGILDAIAQMEPATLLPYRHDIQGALGRPAGDALAAATALALGDTRLATLVIAQGTDGVVQRLIRLIPDTYSEAPALQLLQAALARESVASMALFGIGSLQSKQADQTIWAYLPDPGLGATAAAILARRGDRDTTRRLIELMKTTRAPLTRQRARLALALSDDPHAQAEARNWETTP